MAIDFDQTGVNFDSPLYTFDGNNVGPGAFSDNINDAARLYFIANGASMGQAYNDAARDFYGTASKALNDAARDFWMTTTGSTGQSYNDAGLKYFNDALVLVGGSFNDRAVQFYNNEGDLMPQAVGDDYQWIMVSDFTPGIRQKINYEAGAVSPSFQNGTASVDGTYRCIALAGGGLGPLPGRVGSKTIARPDATADVRNNAFIIVGAFSQGPVNAPVTPTAFALASLFLAIEWVKPIAGQRRFQLIRYQAFDPTTQVLIENRTITNATSAAAPGYVPCHIYTHRISTTGVATAPGLPLIVYRWWDRGAQQLNIWSVWPSPNTVPPGNSNTAVSITTGKQGEVHVVHQARSVGLETTIYLNGAANNNFQENEQFFNTAANLTTGLNATANVYEGETVSYIPFIYSSNAQELFVNKSRFGSYMIRGDINDPTVYRLPGVVASQTQQVPAMTANGLAYCVLNGGVWLWGGGGSAEKISDALEDNFWGPANPTYMPYYPFYEPYAGRLMYYKDWLFVPNNWLFSFETNSWWRFDNVDEMVNGPIMYWNEAFTNTSPSGTSVDSDLIFGTPMSFSNATDPILYYYNMVEGATNFKWTSQPMAETVNNLCDVREFVIVAAGVGTVTVTLTGIDGVVSAPMVFTFTDANNPKARRSGPSPVGGPGPFQATHIQVEIESDGDTDPAPIVYEFRMAINQRMHLRNE